MRREAKGNSKNFGLRISNFGMRDTTMERVLIDSLNVDVKSAFRNFNSAILLGALLLAFCFPAEAQQRGKVYRIGYLSATHRDRHAQRFQAFRQRLRELGYVDGRNITITDRYAEGKAERIPELVAELIRLKVDVILAGGSQAAGPAKEATRTIPIVVVHFEDPVREGFVTSLARPGGNITGLSRMSSDLEGKRLELLKETIPKVRRVALFLNPANPTDVLIFGEADSAARGLGLQLQRLEVRSPDDLDSAFAILTKDQAHALMPSADPLLNAHHKRIIDFAARNRLPTMFNSNTDVEAGGLMSYAPNMLDLFRRAAVLVDKILKGTKPADIPVEQPMKFEFVINLKTAKQIGLTIPPNVLARADKVIR